VRFTVIDVETANPDLSSICQVGIATFLDGAPHQKWVSLVNPEDEFDGMNVSIHGITEEMVADAPTWRDVYPTVKQLLQGNVVVSHTPFDRVAVSRACERLDVPVCDCQWLDSARVVRRAWPIFAQSGYGISNVAAHFSIKYKQHDALEDAICAGVIMLRAITETGLNVEQWLRRVEQPIHPHPNDYRPIMRDGNPDGELYGEVLVFTGALSMPRRVAANLASSAGCRVDDGVTKHTTLLVVGDQDIKRLAGQEKSSKHRRAEELIAAGKPIRILTESDFQRVVVRSKAAAV
jgi:DNA polymerase III subunit epsilon